MTAGHPTGKMIEPERIEDMDAAEAKQYLKRLIKDNMIVGMEIIKGK